MRPKVYTVTLGDEEQATLPQLLRAGSHKARTRTRACILLHAHRDTRDEEIVAALGTSMRTGGRMRTQCSEDGLDAARYAAPRPGGKPTRDGGGKA